MFTSRICDWPVFFNRAQRAQRRTELSRGEYFVYIRCCVYVNLSHLFLLRTLTGISWQRPKCLYYTQNMRQVYKIKVYVYVLYCTYKHIAIWWNLHGILNRTFICDSLHFGGGIVYLYYAYT